MLADEVMFQMREERETDTTDPVALSFSLMTPLEQFRCASEGDDFFERQ